MTSGGTKTTHPKNDAFDKLAQPNTRRDIYMIIGIFEFYRIVFP